MHLHAESGPLRPTRPRTLLYFSHGTHTQLNCLLGMSRVHTEKPFRCHLGREATYRPIIYCTSPGAPYAFPALKSDTWIACGHDSGPVVAFRHERFHCYHPQRGSANQEFQVDVREWIWFW